MDKRPLRERRPVWHVCVSLQRLVHALLYTWSVCKKHVCAGVHAKLSAQCTSSVQWAKPTEPSTGALSEYMNAEHCVQHPACKEIARRDPNPAI